MPLRILLIEDNPSDAAMVRHLLREGIGATVEVHHASSLDAGIQSLRDHDVDIILLDHQLPDSVGPDSVGRLRTIHGCPPIVMLTGMVTLRAAESCLGLGAQDYLVKGQADAVMVGRAVRYAIERHAAEARLHALATMDSMTGLPNRAYFQAALNQACERVARHGGELVLLYLDVDGFKDVNDTLGHAAGDELLRRAAQRLLHQLRAEDLLCRLGGDEFAVVLEGLADPDGAAHVAHKLVESVSAPFRIEEGSHPVRVSASIGIATLRTARDAESLMRQADLAMYSAKEQGSTWRFFEPRLQVEVERRIRRQAELRQALEKDEFELHYQPIVAIHNGVPAAFEALARWQRPDGINLGGSFIPDIEHSSLAIPFGCWVIDEACRQLGELRDRGSDASITINISPRQVLPPPRERRLVDVVSEALERHGADPACLIVEVTEATFAHDLDRTSKLLGEIRALGVRVAIDDFGAGYSSLQYLARLPVDLLKVDGSFVKRSETPRGRALLEAIVRLGQSVGMQMVAEWVETPEHVEMLRSMGCPLAQGWHFGAARAASDVHWPVAKRGGLRLLAR